MPEIRNLTALRGIAALLVILHHFTGPVLPALQGQSYTQIFRNGDLAVDFFFLLSGFVIAHVYGAGFANGIRLGAFMHFMWHRFARLYPLHLVCLLLLLLPVALQAAPMPWEGRYSVLAALHNLAMTHGPWLDYRSWNYPAWSISAEWHAYMLFPMLAALLLRGGRSPVLSALTLAAAAGVVLWLDLTGDISKATNGSGVLLRVLAEFAAGVMLYRFYRQGVLAPLLRDDRLLVAATLLLVAILQFDLADWAAVFVMPVVLLAAAHNSGHASRLLSAAPLVHLGTISYSLYMTHAVVEQYFRQILGLLGVTTTVQWGVAGSLLAAMLLTAIVIVYSGLSYRLIEAPARDWLRGRGSAAAAMRSAATAGS